MSGVSEIYNGLSAVGRGSELIFTDAMEPDRCLCSRYSNCDQRMERACEFSGALPAFHAAGTRHPPFFRPEQ